MNKDNFKVSLDALSTLKKIKDIQGDFSELINEEIIDVKNGKIVATLIFEKYYLRSSNWAALIVTVDNIEEVTQLHIVSTASASNVLGLDWGSSKNFVNNIRKSLINYIIE